MFTRLMLVSKWVLTTIPISTLTQYTRTTTTFDWLFQLPHFHTKYNSNTLIASFVVDHTYKSHTRLANLYWRFNYVQKTKWYHDMYLTIYPPIKHLSASQMFNLHYKQINMQVIHHTSVHDNSYVIKLPM
jgi:hypothetical protein